MLPSSAGRQRADVARSAYPLSMMLVTTNAPVATNKSPSTHPPADTTAAPRRPCMRPRAAARAWCCGALSGPPAPSTPPRAAGASLRPGSRSPRSASSGTAALTGTRPRTIVPVPGEDSIVASPPNTARRSCMPCRPVPFPSVAISKPSPSSRTSNVTTLALRQRDVDPRGVRVLRGVLERLEHAEVDRGLDLDRMAPELVGPRWTGDPDRAYCAARAAATPCASSKGG